MVMRSGQQDELSVLYICTSTYELDVLTALQMPAFSDQVPILQDLQFFRQIALVLSHKDVKQEYLYGLRATLSLHEIFTERTVCAGGKHRSPW